MRSTKPQKISISLPPDMITEVQEMALDEKKSVSEIFCEAFRQYADKKILEEIRKKLAR